MKPDPTLSHSYLAYGCNLSSDVPLVQLLPGRDAALETLVIKRVDTLPKGPDDLRKIGPFAQAAPNFLAMQIKGVVDFVALDGDTLLYRPHDDSDLASMQVFLLGSGLGALLMQRRLLVMHGNAVEVEGSCVLCVGPSGVGKSTTAAGLMQRGFRVLSDDVCAIDAQSRVVPGIPHIKLWQEAADSLELATQGLSRIRPELEKYRMPMGDAFCADPVAVKTIYVLSPHQSEEIEIEPMMGPKKFTALRGNTYRLRYVKGMALEALHFQQLAELSKHVTVKRLYRPREGFQLDQLLDALIADATGQGPR